MSALSHERIWSLMEMCVAIGPHELWRTAIVGKDGAKTGAYLRLVGAVRWFCSGVVGVALVYELLFRRALSYPSPK